MFISAHRYEQDMNASICLYLSISVHIVNICPYLYLSISINICAYLYICLYLCICLYLFKYVHICSYVYICSYDCICQYGQQAPRSAQDQPICVHICAYTVNIHSYLCVSDLYQYIYAYIRTYLCISVYI